MQDENGPIGGSGLRGGYGTDAEGDELLKFINIFCRNLIGINC